jgi:hypothetical protein
MATDKIESAVYGPCIQADSTVLDNACKLAEVVASMKMLEKPN